MIGWPVPFYVDVWALVDEIIKSKQDFSFPIPASPYRNIPRTSLSINHRNFIIFPFPVLSFMPLCLVPCYYVLEDEFIPSDV